MGLRAMLSTLGASAFVFPILFLIMPFIQSFLTTWQQKNEEFQEAKLKGELWKLRVDILPVDTARDQARKREEYRSVVP